MNKYIKNSLIILFSSLLGLAIAIFYDYLDGGIDFTLN